VFRIAIPTHAREKTIAGHTLGVLCDGGIPADRVTLFVATDDEANAYRRSVDPALYGALEVTHSKPGLAPQRAAIMARYPVGTRLLQLDDDVRAIEALGREGNLELVGDLSALFTYGFRRADRLGAYLWGLYPVRNAYYMKRAVRTGLCHIIGCFFGIRVRHRPMERTILEGKEDYERSLAFFKADGHLCRLEDVCVSQANPPGGLDPPGTGGRDFVHGMTEIAYLQERFPGWVHMNPRRATSDKYPEILLRETAGDRLPTA
jgi:hypothetical protein